jgi:HPt (histidine-containing phosphotransfer) domain-containing protein
MKTETLSVSHRLQLDPFWAGILGQASAAQHPLHEPRETPDASAIDIPSAAETCPAIDVANLLDECRGDRACATIILQKFTNRAADQLAALDRAVNSRNAAELTRQAHTLGGIAENLSAGALVACAARLQWQAKIGAWDRVECELESVHAEVARCLEAVPDLLARFGQQRRVSSAERRPA